MPICTQKDTQPHSSSGKWKLNPQLDITPYPLKWLKFKKLAIANVDKGVEELELSYTAGREEKLYKHFRKPFGSFLKS